MSQIQDSKIHKELFLDNNIINYEELWFYIRDIENKISNALMALGLYEVGSKSENLPRYIENGLELISELKKLSLSEYESHLEITEKVFKDMKEGKEIPTENVNEIYEFLYQLDEEIGSLLEEKFSEFKRKLYDIMELRNF